MDYSFIRYLESKQTVDDRALNQQVWQAFWEGLPGSSRQFPLEMVEFGAGTGAMTKRIVDSGKISTLMYTAVDDQPANVEFLKNQSVDWLERRPFINLFAEVNTAEEFVAEKQGEQYFDAILAHAFLDLTDLDEFLPEMLELLPAGGIGYFTINFDGDTIFQPPHPADDAILAAYHGSMRDPYSGRKLLLKLTELETEILAAGSSDWVVYPSDKQYPADEGYFLHHILSFFEQSLTGREGVEPEQLRQWLEVRHAQIEAGELIYIAHQLDVVFKKR
ncbi:MAG: class I SAM-dependent methyltransferase [Anaerolineae bacterium]